MNRLSIPTRRLGFGLSALVVSMAGALPLLTGDALAAGQVQTRSITMSTSKVSTAAKYVVSFNTATTGVIQGIVVDFCDGSSDPIMGDACTAPAGMTVSNTSSVTITGGLTGTWTAANPTSDTHALAITNASGGSVTAGTAVSFSIDTGIVNPSSAGSFYARVSTFTTNTAAAAYTSTAPGSYTDYGGFALSTAADVQITARVMETLSFCVFKSSCGDTPSVTLGHGTGTKALDNTAVDTDTAKFTISTNALSGVNIRMYGDTLKSGSNSITAAGSSPVSFTANQASSDFGMYLSALTATTGTLNKAATYNGGSGSQYGFNLTNVTNAATGGDTVASSSGTPASVNGGAGTMTFGAIAALTTPAGIYTADEQFTATGTF